MTSPHKDFYSLYFVAVVARRDHQFIAKPIISLTLADTSLLLFFPAFAISRAPRHPATCYISTVFTASVASDARERRLMTSPATLASCRSLPLVLTHTVFTFLISIEQSCGQARHDGCPTADEGLSGPTDTEHVVYAR